MATSIVASALRANGYYLDAFNNILYMTAPFEKKSNIYGTPEYKLVCNIMAQYPDVQISIQKKSRKQTLRYDMMREFINIMPDSDKMLKEFERVQLIDRMSHVSMHTERYQELPEKLDAKMTQLSFSAGNPFLRQEDITWVKLRFRRHDVDKVLDRFGFNIQMIPDGDWCFTTTVAVEPTSEFYGWLLATGGEVLEPSLVQTSMSLKLMMANSVYTRMRRERKQIPPAHKV